MRVRRHQWVVAALIVVVSILYGYRESQDIAPWYSAMVTLRSHPDRLNLVSGDAGDVSSEEDMRQLLNTIVEASNNTAISKRVIEANDLISNVDFAGPMATTNSMVRLARSLSGRTSAKARNETWLIDLRVYDGNQDLVKDLANWVGAAVVEQQNVVLGYDPENELARVRDEIEQGRQRLRNAEVALIEFRRNAGLALSLEERMDLEEEGLTRLHERRAEQQAEFMEVAGWQEMIRGFGKEPSVDQLLAVPEIYHSDSVQWYEERLRALTMEVDELQVVGEATKEFKAAEALLAKMTARRDAKVYAVADELDSRLEQVNRKGQRLQNQIEEAENAIQKLSVLAVEYRILEGEIELAENALSALSVRENEWVRRSERPLPPLTMVERAHSASNQTADPAAKIFTSALFGLIIAAFVVWFWAWRPPRQENGKAAAAA